MIWKILSMIGFRKRRADEVLDPTGGGIFARIMANDIEATELANANLATPYEPKFIIGPGGERLPILRIPAHLDPGPGYLPS